MGSGPRVDVPARAQMITSIFTRERRLGRLLLFLMLVQRQFVRGLASGAVKDV